MNTEVMEYLRKHLKPENLKRLAELVDFDTTGNQDDPLYLVLMEAWNLCNEDE